MRVEVYLFGENASCAGLGHTSPPCDSPRFTWCTNSLLTEQRVLDAFAARDVCRGVVRQLAGWEWFATEMAG